jgi:general secretion pathway protein K
MSILKINQQRGVAIITALLIVTIAATVSITISTKLQLDVRRTSNMVAKDQADFILQAAETWSRRILKDDQQNNQVDDLSEDWAQKIPPIPVAGGSIEGSLTDLNRCLNVNDILNTTNPADNNPNTENAANTDNPEANAATGTPTNPSTVSATTENRIRQLFTNADINANLTQAIIDWIDTDLNTTNPDGAEDGHYLNLQNPYHTANTELHSISELRLIKGFEDIETYDAVKDDLCAFIAKAGSVSINVNTASAEVLQSLAAKMTPKLAEDIISRRDDDPFDDLGKFTSFQKLSTIISDTALLGVTSDYFLLKAQAKIGPANKVMYSVIYRDSNGDTEVISRVYRTL